MIDRRTFLAGTGAVLLAAPLAAEAQQGAKVPQLGYIGLVPTTSPASVRVWDAFLQGLRDQGYVTGRNLGIERRYLEGKNERASIFVTDFLEMKVDIIVTPHTLTARTAKERTSTIPIVFIGVSNPVRDGLVASLARPGGNVTGISGQFPDLQAKALQILREALPRLSRVAVLWDPANPASAADWTDMETITKASGWRWSRWRSEVWRISSRLCRRCHASDQTRCGFTSLCSRTIHASWSMPRCTGCQSWQ